MNTKSRTNGSLGISYVYSWDHRPSTFSTFSHGATLGRIYCSSSYLSHPILCKILIIWLPTASDSTTQSLTLVFMHPRSLFIAMARSLKLGTLALLISSVTSLRPVNLEERAVTPVCQLLSNPSTAPAYNYASWCSCQAPSGGAYPGAWTTTSPPGISSPTGNQLCSYTTLPRDTNSIIPTPVTCNVASPTSGFTVPHSWCDCTAGTSTGTYSTKLGTFTGSNDACSFMQDQFNPTATISPSSATCQWETASPPYTVAPGPVEPGPFYDALGWCACGDNNVYPLLTQSGAQPTNYYHNSASVQPCNYTTTPTTTITALPVSSTSCQLVSKQPLTISVCECSGNGTSILYPTGTQTCLFSQVPPTPITLESLYNKPCNIPYDRLFCDYDQKTLVSPNSEIWIKEIHANSSLFQACLRSIGNSLLCVWLLCRWISMFT